MKASTADFRSFIQDLIRDNFIPDTVCTFTMLGINNSIDIVISGIGINDIQIAEDADLILLMTNGNTIKIVYDSVDMEDVTDDLTYHQHGQIWEWRFNTGNSYAALTFETAA